MTGEDAGRAPKVEVEERRVSSTGTDLDALLVDLCKHVLGSMGVDDGRRLGGIVGEEVHPVLAMIR